MKAQLLSAAAVSAILVIAAGVSAASAQAMDPQAQRNVGVMDRPRPDYDAAGIRSGAFIILPRLTTTVDFDDNIYAGSTTKTSDTVVLLQPEVTVRSDWSRNMVEAYARAAFSEYASHSSENTTEYEVRGGGRYDIAEDSNLNGGVRYARLMEPRYLSNTTQNVRHPVQYDLTGLNFGGVQTFNRLRLLGDVKLLDYSYDNAQNTLGQTVLEKDRDRTEWFEAGRVEYAYSPDTALFVAGTLNQRSYSLKPPASLFNRDSNGFDIAAGARLDLSHLARGEFQVGYLNQDYDSSVFHSVSGLSMHGKVDFFATPLTTVTVSADRAVGDAADPRASGYLTTDVGAEVDHELMRNVILMGKAFYGHDEYKGIARTDDRWTARIGATYLVNRNVGISIHYDYVDISSSGADRINSYKVNQLLVSLVLQR
jgi:hypothetical protein